MDKYLVTYQNKEVVVEAKDMYSAKRKAVHDLSVPLSKLWLVDVRLIKNGEVTIDANDL